MATRKSRPRTVKLTRLSPLKTYSVSFCLELGHCIDIKARSPEQAQAKVRKALAEDWHALLDQAESVHFWTDVLEATEAT